MGEKTHGKDMTREGGKDRACEYAIQLIGKDKEENNLRTETRGSNVDEST